ncbi:WhiB family transcriptional regulator [Streptomyces olivaceoviridis]
MGRPRADARGRPSPCLDRTSPGRRRRADDLPRMRRIAIKCHEPLPGLGRSTVLCRSRSAWPHTAMKRCVMTRSSIGHPAASDWRDQASCAGEDPDIFFPLSDLAAPGTEAALARAICRRCPVLIACRTWALDHGEDDGIWGATTAAQRRAIRRATTETIPAVRRRGDGAGEESLPG